MSDGKVVSLSGQPLPSPGEPNAALMNALEDLLEKARSGEISGAGIAGYYADGATSYFIVGAYKRIRLIGALSQLLFIANKSLWDTDQA